MTSIPNLHRYIYFALGAVLAVCLAIQSGALVLPPYLAGGQFFAVVGVIALGFFLPHFGAETEGVTTLPIVAPPPKVPADPAPPPVVPPPTT